MKTLPIANQFGCAEGYAGRNSLGKAEADPSEQTASRNGWYLPVKAVLDFAAAAVLLLLAAPVIGVCALAVALTSRGGAFYCQRRVGKDGREFTLIKLRTMRADAEALTGPVWSVGRDPRVTALGRFLRDTHLDELPQLVNVLFGQMSLVGPRPERPLFVAKLREEIPFYEDRIKVRPGITGLAQMRLPPDTDLESVRRKVFCDRYYVKHLSPWLDLLILGHTAAKFVGSIAAPFAAKFELPAPELAEEDLSSRQRQEVRERKPFPPENSHQGYPGREFTPDRAQAPI